jgi:N-acetylmuramoyl-L-alanine amidase
VITRHLRLVAALAAGVWLFPALAIGARPVVPGKSPSKKAASQKSGPTTKARPTPTPASKTSKSSGKSSAAKPAATPPPAKPDRSLFQAAERAEKTLRASSRLKAKKAEWEKVASAYRAVVDKYPRSPYCDDALLAAGDLQREMSNLFNNRRYSDQALESYALIVAEYPGSSLGEPALFATYEIQKERSQASAARETAEKYLAAYPDGKRSRALRQVVAAARPSSAVKAVEKSPATGAPAAGAPPTGGSQFERTAVSTGHVQIYGVRFWSGESSTRVVIDLDRKVEITQSRLQDPPRLFVDLMGTRLHPNLVGKTFPVGNAFLKQIRIGVNRENVVRVVIDFGEASSHNVFFLADPERLVIDVRGESGQRTAALEPRPVPSASPIPAGSPQEVAMESVQVTQTAPVLPQAPDEAEEEPQVILAAPTPTPAPIVRPVPTPLPTPEATPTPRALPSPPPAPTATNGTPVRNRDGSYSLARQLGLGAKRIALDAGHGGHDPGAIGKRGTQEKDITLAIVLKLEKLLRNELGADVVMTRDRDVFIPLEERTAIANASGADLFLSVHINSARNSAGRGLETYYLSFAKNAAAEELAARENAISQATMKDLNNLVKAITTNSKIDESRDFAGLIQRSNVEGLSPSFQGVLDRGVHTAPFYVLIGANMPSILTEVGFISNPEEERWLRSDEYQDKLAEALLEGVRAYLGQLNRTQATKLEKRTGVRVTSKGGKR